MNLINDDMTDTCQSKRTGAKLSQKLYQVRHQSYTAVLFLFLIHETVCVQKILETKKSQQLVVIRSSYLQFILPKDTIEVICWVTCSAWSSVRITPIAGDGTIQHHSWQDNFELTLIMARVTDLLCFCRCCVGEFSHCILDYTIQIK